MPKVVLSKDAEKQNKRYDYIAGMLVGGIRQQCLTTKDVSAKSGIPERTVTQRLRHPEEIRLADLYRLADIAGVSISFSFKQPPD